jgi:hypothetical protein
VTPRRLTFGLAAGLISAIAGLASVRYPLVATAAPVAALAALGLVLSSEVRLAVLTLGALTVFQSSSAITPPKIAYILICLIAGLIALTNRKEIAASTWGDCFKPAWVGAAVLAFTLTSTFVTRDSTVHTTSWLRDILPYYLLVLAPLIAIDIGRRTSSVWILRLLISLAILTAAVSGLDYASKRGGTLPFTSFLLGSGVPAILGFCYALPRAAFAEKRAWWVAAIFFIPVCLLISGSRTNLILLLGVFGATGGIARRRIPPLRTLVITTSAALGLVILLPIVAGAVYGDRQYFQARVQASMKVLTGDASADPSYQVRAKSYQVAVDEIGRHPVFGTGPGYLYNFSALQAEGASGVTAVSTFSLDTPLATVAKLGIVGSLALVGFLLSLVATVKRVTALTGPTDLATASRAFAFIFIADLPFGSFLEDKGFFIAMLLLLSATAASVREATGAISGATLAPVLVSARR